MLVSIYYWVFQWSWFAWVNALCNLSWKKLQEVAASLPGQFLSRCCFTLCITMEAEPRIAKQYICHHCCSCKNYWGKGMEGGKKSVFASFFGWPEDHEFVEKLHLELRSSTYATTVAVAKITRERGWKVEKKCHCIVFQLTRRSRVWEKNAFWGIL